jgi:hypothetical protein
MCWRETLHGIFFLKCLFEHPEYMFIYLEGKYNSLKGNLIILGTIMVIDAYLKMLTVSIIWKTKKYPTIRGMKRGGF